jgi:hypothetical protein
VNARWFDPVGSALKAMTALVALTVLLMVAQSSPSRADCLRPDSQLSPQELAKLQANPAGIFLNAQGGTLGNAELISKVRDLVRSDKAALKVIIDALKFASAEEKSAIGTALGQAAQACLGTDAGYAAEIQQALAETTDQSAILAFSAVTGDVPIGDIGGGAGAGGGAGGSSVGGGPASGTGAAGVGGGGVRGTTLTNVLTTAPIIIRTFAATTPTTGAAITATATTSVSP